MIKITFPDGSVKEFARGTTAYQVAESISPRLAADCLAASVNGATVDMTRAIEEDASVKFYKWDDAEGKHAFWHTSSHPGCRSRISRAICRRQVVTASCSPSRCSRPQPLMSVRVSSPSTPKTAYSRGLSSWLTSVWGTLALTITASWMATGNSSRRVRKRPWPPVMKKSSAQPWVWRLEFHSLLYWAWET